MIYTKTRDDKEKTYKTKIYKKYIENIRVIIKYQNNFL